MRVGRVVAALVLLMTAALAGPVTSAGAVPPVFSNYKVLGMGYNASGELGNNSTAMSYTPVQALGLPSTVRKVVSGQSHNIALDSSGSIWGWGDNAAGKLGDGTTTDRLAAVRIYGLSEVTQIAAGSTHSLALRSDGTVWAWGENSYGQLGDGSTTHRLVPTQVPGITNAVAVAGGWFHSIALLSNGTVLSWGYNFHGQLGDGTTIDHLTPAPVYGITNAVKISAGSAGNTAILSTGRIARWGDNSWGQLGIGNTLTYRYPVYPASPVNVIQTADSQTNAVFALTGDGKLWAWGYNGYDQLGDGTSISRSLPVHLWAAPAGITQLAAGGGGSLVVTSAGRVWAWGTIGYSLHYAVPTQLTGISGAVSGSFGAMHMEAVIKVPMVVLPRR
jgi:alpha-tubulin suppressor-like RCC1 family protein